mmetsp:Transcript_36662/g.93651  ORF Transcript_36662/g.93651 Transcript_36662/m.93651 type:complete len:231 (+) Transcript_36662:310-1002(+)
MGGGQGCDDWRVKLKHGPKVFRRGLVKHKDPDVADPRPAGGDARELRARQPHDALAGPPPQSDRGVAVRLPKVEPRDRDHRPPLGRAVGGLDAQNFGRVVLKLALRAGRALPAAHLHHNRPVRTDPIRRLAQDRALAHPHHRRARLPPHRYPRLYVAIGAPKVCPPDGDDGPAFGRPIGGSDGVHDRVEGVPQGPGNHACCQQQGPHSLLAHQPSSRHSHPPNPRLDTAP